MTTAREISESFLHRKKVMKSRMIGLVVLIAVYGIVNLCLGGRVLTIMNIKTVVSHAVFPAFVAWGMSFIFTAGVVDLSIGANVLLASNIGAICAVTLGLGYPGLMIGTILSAVALQHISTRCVVNLKIPSWIAGLGMALIFEAALSQYATYRAKSTGSAVINIGGRYDGLGNMPWMAIIWIIGLIMAYILYNHTSIGINVRAIGGEEAVAQAMGINKKKVMLIGAAVGGIFIGCAGLIQISYNSFMGPQSGLGSINTIFKALATVLLAQSFEFLVSTPVGIFLGSIIVMSIFNILSICGVPSGTGQEICLGVIVIMCGIISQIKYKGVVK